MKNLFQKCLMWANTWTNNQLVFVIILVIALSYAAVYATCRCTVAHGNIQTLTTVTNKP